MNEASFLTASIFGILGSVSVALGLSLSSQGFIPVLFTYAGVVTLFLVLLILINSLHATARKNEQMLKRIQGTLGIKDKDEKE
jgi:hypothetical protein